MALFSLATGVRFPSCLSRDHSVFLRMDRIADNSEETDAIFFFRRWMEETIEYNTTRMNMAKIAHRYCGSNRDAGRLLIDSTIQEIIMPGLSIVFPHFPMMELSMVSPLRMQLTRVLDRISLFRHRIHPVKRAPGELGSMWFPSPGTSPAREIPGFRCALSKCRTCDEHSGIMQNKECRRPFLAGESVEFIPAREVRYVF